MTTLPGRRRLPTVLAALTIVSGESVLADTLDDGDGILSRAAEVASIFKLMAETLPGKWHGAYADGTADNPIGDWTETSVEYELTAGGTALIENYVDDRGRPYMTTVYHQDNNDLRATHFCGARNHPRMIARKISHEERSVEFDFVDVANLKTVNSYHSRGLLLEIISEDSIILTFTGLEDGARNTRAFKFEREAD
ncbi:MAG: hypothetical protein QNJ14_00850 [Woeseiaceae bacterium]|nr:hypothetical protein [Woeseiaceae bacterium]